MAKNEYIGVNNVARKVKQPYIGVGNVARKVKSGFVGVNGIARQYYESVVYHTWKRYNLTNVTFNGVPLRDKANMNSIFEYSSYYDRGSVEMGFPSATAPIAYGFTGKTQGLGSNLSGTTGISSTKVSNTNVQNGNTTLILANYSITIDSNYLSQATVSTPLQSSGYYLASNLTTKYTGYISHIQNLANVRLNNYRNGTNIALVPGLAYSGDSYEYYHSYSSRYVAQGPVLHYSVNSCLLFYYIWDNDDDYDYDETYLYQADNCAEDIVAPAGTYPDNGPYGGYIYVKQ